MTSSIKPVRKISVAFAALAVLALTACHPGTPPAGTPTPAHPHSLIDAACIPGHWTSDIQTMAQEIADALPDGTEVVGLTSSGTQTYDFTAHDVTIDNDFTIDITIADDGHTLETAINRHGTATATWELDHHELTMTGVDDGVMVTTTITVDGSGAHGNTVPEGSPGGAATFEAICRGNGFTLAPSVAEDLVDHLSRVE